MECSAFGWEAGGVPGFERFNPMPDPAPPDFAALPVSTRDLFERLLDRLPVGRIRTKVGAEAIMTNESRAALLRRRVPPDLGRVRPARHLAHARHSRSDQCSPSGSPSPPPAGPAEPTSGFG